MRRPCGAGLSYLYTNVDHQEATDSPFSGDQSGIGAYGEAGVEILRMHGTHLRFGLRVDLPFYAIKNASYLYSPGPNGSSAYRQTRGSMYYAPFTLGASISF